MLAAEIQLFPDKTIFIQLSIFLVVLLTLTHFVFKPVLKIIHLRKAKTEGDRKKIEEMTQKTDALMKEYEKKIQEAKQDAFKMKETIRKEGDEQGQRIVHEAKQASLSQIEKIKKEMEIARQNATSQLELQAKTLGKMIAEKVLGRSLDKLN
ncbi:MAG: hypothetical protein A3F82_05730 [Deltaproteobacteria bacterium RIFCSPLOWO2_12_FULL_44_12]|nr:MAG: hypothetical protein A2712_01575 [Deltaproteobacteria bacterium RIFCSPHIGHO2_01_FULL_43_49]OGQ15179.1 MAG: hypothetical protein A3D22_03900 [Deltaproteobacteria bacterium RIFCSPHIGHO2_02_FULL_44_53]OGQ27200.1 MAG: hypothetical protein A3D98_02170 [Deltaproteobacteria bacterium RIFCSPHIGHO2_12_FULL_44_21]OGQ31696.1 MAG: hypothetical protein A2979_05060 [Deltaproteobacteria bacterium RIFCSPLOWO2_01_FULL_45_74]OGQ42896.1 MAG: hypothetical protein A3I70_07365 [Deltaproteobacteria bacterium 